MAYFRLLLCSRGISTLDAVTATANTKGAGLQQRDHRPHRYL